MSHTTGLTIVETGHLSLTKHPLFHPVDLGKKLYSQNKIVWINARMVHISGLTWQFLFRLFLSVFCCSIFFLSNFYLSLTDAFYIVIEIYNRFPVCPAVKFHHTWLLRLCDDYAKHLWNWYLLWLILYWKQNYFHIY